METSHKPRLLYRWGKFHCGCWTGCCVDLIAFLDVSEKNKFLHPVGILGVCRKKCSSFVYLCLPDILNCICCTVSKSVMPVNTGEIGIYIFRIKHYCIPKSFKLIALKAQCLLNLPSYITSLKVCGSIPLLQPSWFLDVGAENLASLHSEVLYYTHEAYFCVLFGSQANSHYFPIQH
jgi:hypothetical protein